MTCLFNKLQNMNTIKKTVCIAVALVIFEFLFINIII